MAIPMPDNKMVLIDHLSVDTAKETLGVFTCASGRAVYQLDSIRDKAQICLDRAKEGKHLRCCDVWFLLEHQLWPKTGYGLCSVLLPWK